jgi:hypothetical protein
MRQCVSIMPQCVIVAVWQCVICQCANVQCVDVLWFFYNVFRATRSKTTSLPAALNQARRIDTLDEFYLYGACRTVLHIIETIVIHCYVMRSSLKVRVKHIK